MRLLAGLYDAPDACTLTVESGQSAPAELTGERLLDAAHALAARIHGARAAAVHATASAHTIIATVAGLIAGVPIVPVPPDCGPSERAHILRDCGAPIALADEFGREFDEEFDNGIHSPAVWPDNIERIPIDITAKSSAHFADDSNTAESNDSTALILYTSGTTGAPKGVPISRDAIAACLDGLADAWQWTADDVLVHGLPLFHVHGLVLGVLGALRVGNRLVHTGKSTPANYARARGSLYFGVPTIWSRVCADPVAAQALSTARLLVSGSAPLPVGVFRQLREFTGSAPVERYGMTETLITVSARADGQRRPGYVGTPIAGVRTRLASDDGTPVAHDGETVGVLEVCGPTVFSGYLGQPTVGGQSSTAESFTDDGWFRTGDVATIDADGWHRIVGRASTDLIKSGGYRIGAGEIEDALLAHPSVREAAVIGVPDDDLGQRIVGYVVASDNVTGSALIEFVANELSWHKRPREIRFVDSLPRNAMGKIQKKSLIDD